MDVTYNIIGAWHYTRIFHHAQMNYTREYQASTKEYYGAHKYVVERYPSRLMEFESFSEKLFRRTCE